MWRPPPPPSYIDTFDLNARDYVVVQSRDGYEMLVHRDCLKESPLLRTSLRKRASVRQDDVVLTIRSSDPSTSPTVSRPVSAAAASRQPGDSGEVEASSQSGSTQVAEECQTPSKTTEPAEPAVLPKEEEEYPVTLVESLNTDLTVHLFFPHLNALAVETIIAYLYYKHRYNGKPQEARPNFDIPLSCTVDVLRVAQLLEC